jgi:hypothetical protein
MQMTSCQWTDTVTIHNATEFYWTLSHRLESNIISRWDKKSKHPTRSTYPDGHTSEGLDLTPYELELRQQRQQREKSTIADSQHIPSVAGVS